jgi:hypothetical protein
MYMLQDAAPPDEFLENQSKEYEERIQSNTGSLGSGFGIIIVGYPGAGKTVAANEFEKVLNEESTSETANVDLNSFAYLSDVDLRGDSDFIDAVVEDTNVPSADLGVIDGALSFEEIERVANFYDEIGIIFIKSHHAARHARLISDAEERGEEFDDEYTREGLRKKDSRAARCGLNELLEAEFFDYEVQNEAEELEEFEKYCRYVGRDVYQDYVYQ